MSQDDATRHLEVIRSLMERSVIYRSLSLPGALVGGILSLATGAALALVAPAPERWEAAGPVFLGAWMGVLAITTTVNLALLGREARRSGRAFFSPGMRTALGLLWPAMVAGGVIGVTFVLTDPAAGLPRCAAAWTLFYGLALASTRPFSPRSIRLLAHAFTILGIVSLVLCLATGHAARDPLLLSGVIMGAGFGLLHLVYALSVRISGSRA